MPSSTLKRTFSDAALALCLVTTSVCAIKTAATEPEATVTTSLNDTQWQVHSIDGEAVVKNSTVLLQFPEEGRIAGTSGCNRFFATVTIEGNAIAVGKAGATQMACPKPLMQQERQFLQALSAVTQINIATDDELIISDAQGKERLRAKRFVEVKPQVMDKASDTVSLFDCGDAGQLSMRYVGPETVEIKHADKTYILPREPSASGVKFAKEETGFWMKGDEAMLTLGNKKITCNRINESG